MLVAAAVLLLAGAPVRADEGADVAAAANPRGDWDFDLAFYGWVSDITGNATVGDVTVDVEPQLWNDIIKNLDIALFGGAEVRYRSRWIFNFDLNLTRLSTEEEKGPYPIGFGPETFTTTLKPVEGRIQVDTPLGPLEVPVQLRPGVLRVDVPRVQTALGPFEIETKLTQVMTRAALGYRAVDEPLLALCGGESQDDPRRLRVDLLAGLRYYRMRTEVDIESPPIRVPPFQVTSSLSGGRVTVGGELLPPQTIALPRVDLPGLQFSGVTYGGTNIHEDDDRLVDRPHRRRPPRRGRVREAEPRPRRQRRRLRDRLGIEVLLGDPPLREVPPGRALEPRGGLPRARLRARERRSQHST